MRTQLCEVFGIEYPIFAFTPSEHVAAAVSRAGGLGVLGCVRFNDAEELDKVLDWMDDNTDGKPYGVDVVMPMKVPTEGTSTDLSSYIPDEHKKFVDETLLKLGIPPLPEGEGREGVLGWLHSMARSHVDVALQHRPVLIANALGTPPNDVIEQCKAAGLKVAALAGAPSHAVSHVANGVDIIIAQGYEAGGHTGEIASMVLTPDIVDAVGPDVPVLGAGGIGSGRQIAASLALGAQGVWTGSIWLGTQEYQQLNSHAGWVEAFQKATSSDTVRTRIYTGKPARLLKSKWTEAWNEEEAPTPLPMPLQNLLVAEAHSRINAAGDPEVVSMPVGQIVGRMNEVRPVAEVMADLDRRLQRRGQADQRDRRLDDRDSVAHGAWGFAIRPLCVRSVVYCRPWHLRTHGRMHLADFDGANLRARGRHARRCTSPAPGPPSSSCPRCPASVPDVARFARWVRDAGFTVYLPSLFGVDGAYPTTELAGPIIERACVSKEFRAFAGGGTSPIVEWLRALARLAHGECGGVGRGRGRDVLHRQLRAVHDPRAVGDRPVVNHPSLPVRRSGRAGAVGRRCRPRSGTDSRPRTSAPSATDSTMTAGAPGRRFAAYRALLGDRFDGRVVPGESANPEPPPFFRDMVGTPHSVVTAHLVDEDGHPTIQARDEILAFLADRLLTAG